MRSVNRTQSPGFLVEAGTNRILVDAHNDFWSFATTVITHRNSVYARIGVANLQELLLA